MKASILNPNGLTMYVESVNYNYLGTFQSPKRKQNKNFDKFEVLFASMLSEIYIFSIPRANK